MGALAVTRGRIAPSRLLTILAVYVACDSGELRPLWDISPTRAAAKAEGEVFAYAFDTNDSSVLAPSHADSPPLPIALHATDERIRFVGRIVSTPSGTKRFAWSGSTIEVVVGATELNLLVKDSATDANESNYLQVVINGRGQAALRLAPGRTVYRIALPYSKEAQRVSFVKRTEADFGSIEFLGFELPAEGRVFAAPAHRPHSLVVLGDSISAGLGSSYVDTKDADPKTGERLPDWSARTENAHLSYGAMAARALNADYIPLAFSGKGIYRNRDAQDPVTYPDLFHLALPAEDKTLSVAETASPASVVINLGTNDFFHRGPQVSQSSFVAAYREFLGDVRARWPHARIFCTVGPMLENRIYEARLDHARAYIKEAVRAHRATGDGQVFYFEVTPQDKDTDGTGADFHPNLITHAKMGKEVAAALRSTLKL
jgi:hypothetical protein